MSSSDPKKRRSNNSPNEESTDLTGLRENLTASRWFKTKKSPGKPHRVAQGAPETGLLSYMRKNPPKVSKSCGLRTTLPRSPLEYMHHYAPIFQLFLDFFTQKYRPIRTSGLLTVWSFEPLIVITSIIVWYFLGGETTISETTSQYQ